MSTIIATNAPHIPVHLGAMVMCVRSVSKHLDLQTGDVLVTNHPGYGDQHLPDVTVVTPVFYKGKDLIVYVANRRGEESIIDMVEAKRGDRLTIKTPGGGGYGLPLGN